MRVRGIRTREELTRRGRAGVLVVCLMVAGGCSSATAPTGTQASSPSAPILLSTGAVPTAPTFTPGDGSTPPASPSEGPIATIATPLSTPPAGTAPVVTLNGPFGSVDRDPSPPGVDWPDASGLQALDTYVHSAPLTLTLVDPDLTFTAWTVSVFPAVSPTSSAALEASPYPPSDPELLRVTGPPRGEWLLRADVTSAGRAAASYFWHLSVPDRDPPADGHVVVPAPHAFLATADARVTGVPGSGCYVGACSDVGRTPPARDLEQLAGTPGGTLTLTLGDTSRFVRWNVSARPVGDTAPTPATLSGGRNRAGVSHATFAAPGGGDWYVAITMTFDRRRGSYTWYARLTIP